MRLGFGACNGLRPSEGWCKKQVACFFMYTTAAFGGGPPNPRVNFEWRGDVLLSIKSSYHLSSVNHTILYRVHLHLHRETARTVQATDQGNLFLHQPSDG